MIQQLCKLRTYASCLTEVLRRNVLFYDHSSNNRNNKLCSIIFVCNLLLPAGGCGDGGGGGSGAGQLLGPCRKGCNA